MRGVLHYMQRTAIQGSPATVAAVTHEWTKGAAEVLAARGGRLLSDATMSRGGVLVESDIGVIDATVETRWRRAAASLGCEEGWTDEPAAEADGE